MTSRIVVLSMLLAAQLSAQELSPRPLMLHKDDASATKADPARQIAECRKQADLGDGDAAFQMGLTYLIGQQVKQDGATAEEYFKKADMTPARMCMAAETYMETALPGRVETAKRWAEASKASCGYWTQAQWYRGNQLGPDTEKEVGFLKQGLAAHDDDFRAIMTYRLGELLLTGTAIAGKPEERVAWIGEAARLRLGQAEMTIAWMYSQHPEEADSPDSSIFLDAVGKKCCALRYAQRTGGVRAGGESTPPAWGATNRCC